MDILRQLLVLLPAILPFIGKILLMIPFVPNKLIPWINTAIATAAKYWVLLGFDMVVQPTEVSMAGFGSFGRLALALLWGALDQYFAGRFYEYNRLSAAKMGQVSWWEQGKKSWY